MKTKDYSPLFKFACQVIKYFLLALLGFAIAYIISLSFGALPIVEIILWFLSYWFWRLTILMLCFLGTVVIFESCR